LRVNVFKAFFKEDIMSNQEVIKKGDFIELEFSGWSNGELFDSTKKEDLEAMGSKEEGKNSKIIVGQKLLVPGFDKALEGKEIGKEYEISLTPEEGFGKRNREFVKILPLKVFTEKQITPQPGMTLALDQSLVRVLAVSGARVSVDFNNPMAGKNLKYKFKIIKKIEDEKEKAEVVFEIFFRQVPDFEIKENKIVVNGEKNLEIFVNAFKDKFKDFLGKDLVLESRE
jgi:FKBP-type peptidyl-prolyl cis-trans isomerase 2